ncbi:MAG TPA: S8 family serine peptidase [Actinomycetota bacterium]|nr:S8 family serine peptidase [Actinomycetota bacterium]
MSRAARAAALSRAGGVRVGTVYGESTAILRVAAGVRPAVAAANLDASPGVAWAVPDGMARIAGPPNDPQYSQQWGFDNQGQNGGLVDADVDAPEGWAAAGLSPSYPTTGGTTIGFVDTGIDTTHPEFQGRIAGCVHMVSGQPFSGCKDGFGHGTHVAGIAAAATNNAQGVAGISFDSRIYVCRALGSDGSGNDSDVAACIHWLSDQGVRIINMSLTVDTPAAVHPAVTAAWNGGDGALLIAAAGNTGSTALQYPAGFGEVVSVGNTTLQDTIAPSSTHNSDVELSAPGSQIFSTWKGGGYATETGTSMASPVVAGTAAIVWQLHPTFTARQVRTKLHNSVDDLGTAGKDEFFGFGRINLCLAAGGSCTYTPGQSNAGAISGTVKTTGGAPVDARLSIVSGPTAGSTRADGITGRYSLPGLQPGAYSVRAKKKGCQALTKPATVKPSTTTKLNFVLTCS